MNMNIVLIALGMGLLGVGVAVATIMLERVTNFNKEKKYEQLHSQMGLDGDMDGSRILKFTPPDKQ